MGAEEKAPESEADRRQRYIKRHGSLRNERASWEQHWGELADYVKPRRSRLLRAKPGQEGVKKHDNVINNAGGRAVGVLAAGMMAGITSPARAWFMLTVANKELMRVGAVKEWLHAVVEIILDALQKSNAYLSLHQVYVDLAVFGPGVIFIEEDTVNVIRTYSVPVGDYCLAVSDRGQVDTLYRETSLSVGQLVRKFGYEACSAKVRDLFDKQSLDEQIEVLHIIEPRIEREPGKLGPKQMPYASVWLEVAGDVTTGFLRESGFEELPFMAPRWEVSGNEVYGSSPAMEALGDIKALQIYETSGASAAEKIVDPPMGGPSNMEGLPTSIIPGAQNWYDEGPNGQELKPLFQVPPAAIQVIDTRVDKIEKRIEAEFFANIWLMMMQSDGPQMTAEEVRERHEEKMLQLGPVMERLEDELLNLLISRTFGILLRTGRLPPPPQELSGQDLVAEYSSIMAQAQKMVGIGGIERFTNFIARLGEVIPDALDKLNSDELANNYGDTLGVPPKIIRADDEVKKLRAARAQAQQQQAAMEQATAATQAAKNLAQSPTTGQNALTQVLGPVASAEAGVQ